MEKTNDHDHQLPLFAVFTDSDEYDLWRKRGDPVLHIELKNMASLLIIAPLSANSMAKIAHG